MTFLWMIDMWAKICNLDKCNTHWTLPLVPVITVLELPFSVREEGARLLDPSWTHSKHKHLIRMWSFRRHIKVKVANRINKKPTIKHAGNKTARPKVPSPLFVDPALPRESKADPALVVVWAYPPAVFIRSELLEGGEGGGGGGSSCKSRFLLQRSLSLQHFEIYVWLFALLYSQINGLPGGMR